MKDFLTSNVEMRDAGMDQRQTTGRNRLNWRNWFAMLAIQLVDNSAHVSTIYPQIQYNIPIDDVEQFGDHNLSHFHVGEVAGEAPIVTRKRQEFRQRIRQNPKLGHYLAWKRELELVQPNIYNMFKGGVSNNEAHVHCLIPSDDKWKSTPALTQDRVFKTLAASILKGGVWPDVESWDKAGKKGCFVVKFFFWWVFGGVAYVSTLPLVNRLAWKTEALKAGSARERELGWMVTHLKLDELDYPVDFPNGKKADPVLRIHQTSDDLMKVLRADGKKILDESTPAHP